jgi:hypothetical protein
MLGAEGMRGNGIVPHDAADVWYLLGVLNTQVVEAWLRETGTTFRGGWLNCEIRFIRDIPIRDALNSEERRLRALNALEEWGPSDHCRVLIEIE